MSLINDALRKARQEAAEQEAEKRGTTYQAPRAHLPRESKLGQGLLLGLLLGGLVAIIGGAAVWLLLDRNETPTSMAAAGEVPSEETPGTPPQETPPEMPGTASPEMPGTPSESADTPGSAPREMPGTAENTQDFQAPETPGTISQPSAPEMPGTTRETPGTAPEITAPEMPGTAENTQVRQALETPGTTSQEVPGTVDEPSEGLSQEMPGTSSEPILSAPEAAPDASHSAANPSAASHSAADLPRFIQPPDHVGQVAENTFVLEAKIGDAELTLDFIVWSETDPLVQINGQLLGVGQLSDGWMVSEIEREQVTLRSRETTVTLRVR